MSAVIHYYIVWSTLDLNFCQGTSISENELIKRWLIFAFSSSVHWTVATDGNFKIVILTMVLYLHDYVFAQNFTNVDILYFVKWLEIQILFHLLFKMLPLTLNTSQHGHLVFPPIIVDHIWIVWVCELY